ncbi:TonB-dependent receptor plug domain-containing protein [Hydrogenophaga sp.]|uniref:TonB-dependent receptor plug domain-containing protein n=1 Tax=Hydrogenophaga sp. TaxID=1904254 RepID=UPI00286E14DA|nr:TonB-dependent receptor [Hydrogenophaga sp.]
MTALRRLVGPRWLCGGLLGMVASTAPAWAEQDLTAMSLEQLMDIPVMGASKYAQPQHAVAASVSVITRDDIRTFGWRTLGEALASLPGFHTTYDRQYTYVGTRGLGIPDDYNTRLLITLNGNRLNEPTYDSVMAGHEFPLDQDLIERIEVIPGPGGAVYGQNALFGVINVVTRDGAGLNGTEVALGWQSPQGQRQVRLSHGRVLDNGVDLLLSGSALRARGEDRFYDYGAGGAGVAAGLDGERADQLFLRLARGPWSFDLAYGDRYKGDPTAAFLADPLVPGQHIRDSYLSTQLQYEDHFADQTQHLLARVFAGEYRYDSFATWGGEAYRGTAASASRGIELRWLNTAWAAHTFMLGLELQDNPRQDRVSILDDPADNRYRLARGWRAGLYAQDEWRLSDTLVATLGLRTDRNNVGGTRLSPRAALIWQASPASTAKLLFGRAHRTPNVYEQEWDQSGGQYPTPLPAIDDERIETTELVLDHRPAPDLALRASVYQWSLRDMVVWSSPDDRYVSGPPVRARGAEVSADRRWPSGVRLRASVSLQDAQMQGQRLVNSPQWLGKLHWAAPLPGGARIGLEWLAESRRDTVDGGHVAGHALTNLTLSSRRWLPGVRVSLGIYNLLDKRYRQPIGTDNWTTSLAQDGRSVRLKLEARF